MTDAIVAGSVAPPPPFVALPGITVDWLRVGTATAVARWHCEETRRELSEERVQEWCAFDFISSGSYLLRDRRGSTFVDSTRVAFFNPRTPYQTAHPVGFHDSGVIFAIREDVVAEMLEVREAGGALDPARLFEMQDAVISSPTYLRQRQLADASAIGGPLDALAWDEETLALADRVMDEAYRPATGPAPSTALARSRWRNVVEATKMHLASDICGAHRLEALAKACGLSPYHLCRVFRIATGDTIHKHLTQLRLRAALDRLGDARHDLVSLAFDVGFSSHSHFTFALRREFGVPPSQALRDHRGLLR
jgi:AraC family transcriptional regulator